MVVKKSFCRVEDMTYYTVFRLWVHIREVNRLAGINTNGLEWKEYESWTHFSTTSGRIDPEAATKAVPEYLRTNKRITSQAAFLFCLNRCMVYDILEREEEDDSVGWDYSRPAGH
jgi:hypothetical protein